MRQKHDENKNSQKEYADNKRKGKIKDIAVGDEVLVQQKKTSLKTPWDPNAYTVQEIKGSKLRLQREGKIKERAKNNVKLVKKRPKDLLVKKEKETRSRREEEWDLDVDLDKIRVLSAPSREQLEPRALTIPIGNHEEREVEAIPPDQEEGEQDLSSCSGNETETPKKLSPRRRKRLQSDARYKRKEEPLRTEMKIKEKWIVRGGNSIADRVKSRRDRIEK